MKTITNLKSCSAFYYSSYEPVLHNIDAIVLSTGPKMAENRGLQKLYLLKGDNEESNIYVNTVCLPQHQYDGIRFLYRQFQKVTVRKILLVSNPLINIILANPCF